MNKIHLVLKGGHPLHARENLDLAMADARALIERDYASLERLNGEKPWGSIPADTNRALLWWNANMPFATQSITVQTVRVKRSG